MSLQARFKNITPTPEGKWPGKKLFSVKEAAEYLDIHVHKVRNLYRTGVLKVTRIEAQGLLFTRQELDRYQTKLDTTAVPYVKAPSRARPHKPKQPKRLHIRDFSDQEIKQHFHFSSREEMREHLASLRRNGMRVSIGFD